MTRDIERLEESLNLLASAISYPDTPPISDLVGDQIFGESASQRAAPAWALMGLALASLIVLISAIVGAVPSARDAMADLFDPINIFEADVPSANIPRGIEGAESSIDAAEESLGFRIPLPALSETLTPDLVLLQDFEVVQAAALFFDAEEPGRFVFFATNGSIGKGVSSDVVVEPVEEFHGLAYWLEGLRITRYEAVDGEVVERSVRATDVNTLIWEQEGHAFRLEGNLSQDEAVLIARSLR